MSTSQWLGIIFLGGLAFGLYLLIDLARSNMNAFLDKWVGKTLWIWLPFYALQRLIREVILKK
jgi:hypothetical protein